MSNANEKPQFTRSQTSISIAMLLGGAIFVGWSFDGAKESNERTKKVEDAYIVKHECVVATMDGRFPSKYRCDLPEKRYLSRTEIYHAALAEAERDDPTKK